MGWEKSMLIDYAVPFAHDAFIRVNIAGEIRDIQLVSFRCFSPYQDTAEDNFQVQYSDEKGNKYKARDLITGFIEFLKKKEFVINEDDAVFKTLKKN